MVWCGAMCCVVCGNDLESLATWPEDKVAYKPSIGLLHQCWQQLLKLINA
jgi:hypothetical protein